MNIRFNVRMKIDVQIKITIPIPTPTAVMELEHCHFVCGHMNHGRILMCPNLMQCFWFPTEVTISCLLASGLSSFLDQEFFNQVCT